MKCIKSCWCLGIPVDTFERNSLDSIMVQPLYAMILFNEYASFPTPKRMIAYTG